MREVLGVPAYRRLLLAYGLGELAYTVSAVTLSYLVYHRTGSAVGAAGFFICSIVLPALAGPLIVARVDRRSLRVVLGCLYALEAVCFAALTVLVGHFSVVAVLALAVCDGTLTAAARPLVRAAAAEVTGAAGLLRDGAAVTNLVISVTTLGGPLLAGIVVATGGTRIALAVDVVLFAVLAAAMATARVLPRPTTERPPSRGRLGAAARFARDRVTVRTLLGLQVIAIMFFTITIPVEVVYATRSLGAGAGGYGALLTAWGVGALLGSLAYGRWRRAETAVLVSASTASLAVGMGIMAVAPGLWLAILGAALAGVGNGVEAVAVRTALQEATDSEWMALVMSLADSTQQVSPCVGILVGGGLAALAGPRPALAVAAVGALVIAAASRPLLAESRRPSAPSAPSPPV